MLGVANRPIYKWFWKRNKQVKKKVQLEDGSERVTEADNEGAIEGQEVSNSIVV